MSPDVLETATFPFQAWTDYPMLPSEYGKPAPVREITVISYDGDKYCTVEWKGQQMEIKGGYIYDRPATYWEYTGKEPRHD